MRGFSSQQKAQGTLSPAKTLARRERGQKHVKETYAMQAIVLRQQEVPEHLRLEDVSDPRPTV